MFLGKTVNSPPNQCSEFQPTRVNAFNHCYKKIQHTKGNNMKKPNTYYENGTQKRIDFSLGVIFSNISREKERKTM